MHALANLAAQTTQPFWFQLDAIPVPDLVVRQFERARAAHCSALMLTLDLQILGQRHKDLKNGLAVPPKWKVSSVLNMMTKPRWCLGMLGASCRQFGNIVGHVANV